VCTLEFEDHRPLYDWVVENVSAPCRPRQYEFARLNLQYQVLSKRRLTLLVQGGHVSGWDDPRMPTIAGLRRRGYTPAAIRAFCERIGVTKTDATVEMSLLENTLREDLDRTSPRRMAVLRPLEVVLENYPEGRSEALRAPNHPKDPAMGERELTFARRLYIDREDFREEAPGKWKRLVAGGAVRLRNAYVIECTDVIKDAAGEVVRLRCRYHPDSLDANPEGLKVRGVIHWVPAEASVAARVRLYDRLFVHPTPGKGVDDFLEHLNPDSLQVLEDARLEPALGSAEPGARFQFEREGFFCADTTESRPGALVFNRTVTLRDTWAKRAG
jgi:glutaminyl-tRNA synthetase